ncbi:hypothetical protein [Pseudoalteromonas phage H103]|uniref:ATPase n=1 Tax=Pseudoalteromonas phage H103 TaxID=1636200 RepID=UPI0006BC0E02|nr:ATPase [Pseudoalteromonas phage H103]AKA61221.1 hypothetical protein [Pseudoalteromonas phage H103]
MSNIEWEEGAICCAGGQQWDDHSLDGESVVEYVITAEDFQLNEMRIGDYIEASELGTEQKYNDAVEVFELFGFGGTVDWRTQKDYEPCYFYADNDTGDFDSQRCFYEDDMLRKIAYTQLMAIGKLKRAMIEKSAPKIAPDLTPDVEIKSDWSDEHYNHFYQLSEEDIKAGKIKVDAYFVNRMWKINSWEDTGAGFHILKTLPRIANNKNSLKRELVALKKQVDILCKLHGVNDDTN